MAQPKAITIGDQDYPWPLAGYEDAPPLPDEKNDDGKSYRNNASESLSKAYDEFPDPLKKDRRGGLCVFSIVPKNEDRADLPHQRRPHLLLPDKRGAHAVRPRSMGENQTRV